MPFWSILIFSIIALIGYKNNPFLYKFTLQTILFVLIVIFFISHWSLPIWQLSLTLQKVQISWRLAGLLFFGQAILCALAARSIIHYRRFWIKGLIILTIILFLFLNLKFGLTYTRALPTLHSPGKGNVSMREWIETIIQDPYSNRLIDVPEYRTFLDNSDPSFYIKEKYTDAGLIKRPKQTSDFRLSPLPTPLMDQPPVSIVKGQAEFTIEAWESYYRKILLQVVNASTIRLRTYYFPAWQILINNKPYPLQKAKDGTIELNLSPGNYTLILKYEKTWAYSLGITISYLSLLTLVILITIFWLKPAYN
jgi:hypothetical protein